MARYLDPKNDLVFKRIFGEQPHLLISFLNAILPLETEIVDVEYLSPEMVPDTPTKKNSIVDVRCIDSRERTFIVEMQMYWSNIVMNRMVFNTSKAYVRQLDEGESFAMLQPVYGIGIINDVFDRATDEFYHRYQIMNKENTDEIIKGLEYVMIELPKFKFSNREDKKMAVLWLRFLSEINEKTKKVPDELLDNNTMNQALSICEQAAFTDKELMAYDAYWDAVRTEKGLIEEGIEKGIEKGRKEGIEKGIEKGRKEGIEEGIEKGRKEGEKETIQKIIASCNEKGFSTEQIMTITGLSEEQINKLSNS